MAEATDRGSTAWLGIYVEPKLVAGHERWRVLISDRGHDARQRYFVDQAGAYVYALARAEELGLPLFDHSDRGDTP